jgi:molybdopterin synthase sulfur carrier subunit
MMIHIRYFGRLHEFLGCPQESLPVPDAVVDVATLTAWLAHRGESWAEELAPVRGVRVAVNHQFSPPETRLQAGDEVAFLPPFTGG